jgi:hypothetical protein
MLDCFSGCDTLKSSTTFERLPMQVTSLAFNSANDFALTVTDGRSSLTVNQALRTNPFVDRFMSAFEREYAEHLNQHSESQIRWNSITRRTVEKPTIGAIETRRFVSAFIRKFNVSNSD